MTSRPERAERFTLLSWERRSSQRSRPGGWKNVFPWRWRRSNSGRMRRPKQWRPRSCDNLRQCSHCLRGLAAFILAQEASYKNWDGGTRNSTAANYAKAVIKALPEVREDRLRLCWQKLNTKCHNYNFFFYWDFPEIIWTHLVCLRNSHNIFYTLL